MQEPKFPLSPRMQALVEEVVWSMMLPFSSQTFGMFWLSTDRIQAGFELGNDLCLGKGDSAGLHHTGC